MYSVLEVDSLKTAPADVGPIKFVSRSKDFSALGLVIGTDLTHRPIVRIGKWEG
jgi:hypothetical protein